MDWARKKRIKRICPAIFTSKILYILLLGYSGSYLLTDLFMLNANIGISIPTMSHIVWYVDTVFWVYLFYATILTVFDKKKSLFCVAILSFVSLMLLFTNTNVNMHFLLLPNSWIDGGLLRGVGFVGMGILLGCLPEISQNSNNKNNHLFTVLELVSCIAVLFYPIFVAHDSGMVLNHVLWACFFVFLMTHEYGAFSKWLNNQSAIRFVSKYCYEIYVFQLFAITLGQKWFSPHQAPILTTIAILIMSFVFGKVFKDYIEPALFGIYKKFFVHTSKK